MERVRSALPSGWLRDVGPAALVTVVLLAVSGRVDPSAGDRLLDGLAYGLIVVCGGSLMARRRRPVATVAVIAVALAVWLGRGYVGGPVFVTLGLALFVLGGTAPRRVAFITAAAALGLLVVVGEVAGTSPGLLMHAVLVGWSATAVLLGDVVRSRREHVAALEERARHLEQTREEETRRRLAEERLSIARDLHDTVAHSMATINVQAGAAAHVIDRQPEQAREALLVIQQASGEVLDELAALLQLLRIDPGEESAKAPTPGLEDLEELVASARRAGLDVTLRVDETFGDLPRAIAVAAYRIVQESLTNVVRHAGAASATVTLRRDSDGGRSVEIVDDGDSTQGAATRAGTGVGIRGMRERADDQHPARGGTTPRRGLSGARCLEGAVTIRVVLADDQPLVRAGFRMLLDAEDDIVVVGEADDGAAAIELAAATRPDIVLMDIRMPGVDGLEATRRLAANTDLGGVKVMILTTFEVDKYVFEALRAGASGFLVKHTQPTELLRAVRVIAAGEALLSPSVTRRLIADYTARPARASATPAAMELLTEREREVVALVAEGLNNDEIAAELVVATATARTHVSRVMMKLGARDRAQLVVFAYQTGLVTPPSP